MEKGDKEKQREKERVLPVVASPVVHLSDILDCSETRWLQTTSKETIV